MPTTKLTRRANGACARRSPLAALIASLVTVVACSPSEVPSSSPAAESTPGGLSASQNDDRAHLGPASQILFWTPEQQIAGYRNIDLVSPTRVVPAGEETFPLPEEKRDLWEVSYEVEGETFDTRGFMEHNRVAGLLVLDDGAIVFEQYGYGNDRDSRWTSFSIAKSVVSLLVGAAIRDGYIRGVDDEVTDYLPLLEGSSYDGVTLRDVLQMSSGVQWNEDYADPESDVNSQRGGALDRLRYLGGLPRVAAPGTTFNYNTGETHLVGAVVRSAIGNNLSTYLSEKIWKPFGMEADANWLLVEPGGAEHGGCCISATLRDYGRLGLFVLGGGVLPDGTEVLPEGWMAESTTPSRGSEGYGYLWWLRGEGVFWGIGIFGQTLVIDPRHDIVIVTHGAWPRAVGREFSQHRAAFFDAVIEALATEAS